MNGISAGSGTHLGRQAACGVLLTGLALWVGCSDPASTKEPTERSQYRADFDLIFADWQAFLTDLRQLREDYANADPERKKELSRRYDEAMKKGEAMEANLIDAAVIASVKEPEENEDLTFFLMAVAGALANLEEYEDALRMAQILIDNRLEEYSLYYLAAVSGYAAGEFELAEKHLMVIAKNLPRMVDANQPMEGVVAECAVNLGYHKAEWEREEAIREQEKIDGDLPRVVLVTERGEIELELFENEAPNTVASFISLVEKGFYDGLTFYRVVPQTAARAGCPDNKGTGGPGYTIRCECTQPNRRIHFRGSLSMANADRDKGGSEFQILFRPFRDFDGKHTVFGRVVRGLDVLSRIRRRDPTPLNEKNLPEGDKILEAKVIRKRNHPYAPQVIPDEEPDEMTETIQKEVMPF